MGFKVAKRALLCLLLVLAYGFTIVSTRWIKSTGASYINVKPTSSDVASNRRRTRIDVVAAFTRTAATNVRDSKRLKSRSRPQSSPAGKVKGNNERIIVSYGTAIDHFSTFIVQLASLINIIINNVASKTTDVLYHLPGQVGYASMQIVDDAVAVSSYIVNQTLTITPKIGYDLLWITVWLALEPFVFTFNTVVDVIWIASQYSRVYAPIISAWLAKASVNSYYKAGYILQKTKEHSLNATQIVLSDTIRFVEFMSCCTIDYMKHALSDTRSTAIATDKWLRKNIPTMKSELKKAIICVMSGIKNSSIDGWHEVCHAFHCTEKFICKWSPVVASKMHQALTDTLNTTVYGICETHRHSRICSEIISTKSWKFLHSFAYATSVATKEVSSITYDLCGTVAKGINCGLHYTSSVLSKVGNWCSNKCNLFVSRCRHLLTADGLQEIEDFIGNVCYNATNNEIVKTAFGMFLVLNHKKLQKTMLIAHAISYVWPSLKYPFTNLIAYYKDRRKVFKSELPRIRKAAESKEKLLNTLSKIRKEYNNMHKQYRQGQIREDRFQKLANVYYEDVKKIRIALKEINSLDFIVPHATSCVHAQHFMDASGSLLLAVMLGISSWNNENIASILKGSALGRVVYERVVHVIEHFHLKWFKKKSTNKSDYITGGNNEDSHTSWLRANGIVLSRAIGFIFATKLVPSQQMIGWLTTCTVGSYLICEGLEELLDPYLERRNHPFLKKPTDVLALQQALVALGTSDEILSRGTKELVLMSIFLPLLSFENFLWKDKQQ